MVCSIWKHIGRKTDTKQRLYLNIKTMGWLSLRKQLETNNMKFLISMQDYQNELTDSGEYYQYTAEELANQLEPVQMLLAVLPNFALLSLFYIFECFCFQLLIKPKLKLGFHTTLIVPPRQHTNIAAAS